MSSSSSSSSPFVKEFRVRDLKKRMATSSNRQTSSQDSGLNVSFRRRGRVRGFPNACRCGELSVIRTSGTEKNPGRLFHCFPNGSEEDKFHLFKWTDESMVEEIEDMKEGFKKEIEDLKATVCGLEKKMEAMKIEIGGCQKASKEMAGDIRMFKKMVVVGAVVIGCYYWYVM